ncbi:MAG: DUF4405 domain-containing protein [Leisingera sp.]
MKSLRTWATPLTIGFFLLMSVTGILMFYDAHGRMNKIVHGWAGWVMVAGVLAHMLLNWRPFTVYFKRPKAMAIIGAAALVLAVSFFPLEGSGGPGSNVLRAVSQAQIEKVIALTGQDLETGLARLAAAGFEASTDSSVQDLSGGDSAREDAIFAALFDG